MTHYPKAGDVARNAEGAIRMVLASGDFGHWKNETWVPVVQIVVAGSYKWEPVNQWEDAAKLAALVGGRAVRVYLKVDNRMSKLKGCNA